MEGNISLSLLEVAILMLGAIVLGVTIHFFIANHRSLRQSTSNDPGNKIANELDEWKRRYFNDMDFKDRELEEMKKKFTLNEDDYEINMIELDEMKKLNKELKIEIEELRENSPSINRPSVHKEIATHPTSQTLPSTSPNTPEYIEQLKIAQSGLAEQSSKINQLLQQINIVKETEEKQVEIIRSNAVLTEQVDELSFKLSQKEMELNTLRQKEQLTGEMKVMLDKAYVEFNSLQEKMQKLELEILDAKKANIESESLNDVYNKTVRDLEEEKVKYQTVNNENVQLKNKLDDIKEKLKEADFQRLQLQKKVTNLVELNTDMKAIADANMKLEGQIKRIGELENMLHIVLEEKNDPSNKEQNQ